MAVLVIKDEGELLRLRQRLAEMPGAELCELILAASHALIDIEVTEMVADEMGISPDSLDDLLNKHIWPDSPNTGLRDHAAQATKYHG